MTESNDPTTGAGGGASDSNGAGPEPRSTSSGATERPASQSAPSGGADPGASGSGGGTNGPPASGDGGTGPDGAPRKKRRRGKRGGKRHRKKPAGEGANGDANGEQNDAASDGTPSQTKPKPAAAKAAASKPKASAAPRTRQPRASSAGSGGSAGGDGAEGGTGADAATSGSADPATGGSDAPAGDGAAPKRRRRRGGRGRGGAKKTTTPSDAETKKPEAAKPEAAKQGSSRRGRKPATSAAGSTRLAARAQRRQQRPRRPRRKLTEEEAKRLRGEDKVMLVHNHEDRTQMAILEEGALIEHYVARKGARTTMAGNVYLGKVQNVLPGMEAAFVDFGRGRNGVLYAGEVNYSAEDLEGDTPPRIEHVLKNGQKLMVQVTKDPIGNKGARLTTQISLAGRYMVLAPDQQVTGISRRLAENERGRLRQFLREMRPDGHGVIVRTAAEGISREALERDLQHLLSTWEKIQKSSKRAKAPNQLYAEPDLVQRVIRDEFSEDFTKVVVDTRDTYEEIREYLEAAAPDLLPKLELHEGALPLFEEWRVTEQLHKALERKVWLPSGGSIVIDRTEALTVIDVNTGKFTGKGSTLEDTVFANNLEAAEEVARQLRLRDIGGIIVIDFIDMIDPKNQKELLRTLKRALSKDKTRSQVFEVSNLGLVEMTRKKVSEGLLDAFSEPCPNCEGRGIVLTHDIE